MTPQQERFLELAVIIQAKYSDISKELQVDRRTLSQWEIELKPEMQRLSNLRKIWSKKFRTTPFNEFSAWLTRSSRRCFYCQISEDDIDLLIRHNLVTTKRLKTRGRKLEIERLQPNKHYDDLENLVFCCYWCNNAKTDEFTAEEFQPIGESMRHIWQGRLAKVRTLEDRLQQRFSDGDGIKIISHDDRQ